MLTHRLRDPADPGRAVVLGSGGFVGRALMSALVRAGITSLGLRSADLDLAADDAGDSLAHLLAPGDSIIMLSAVTPDKGGGVGTFMANLRMMSAVCSAIERVPPAHVVCFSSATVYPTGSALITETTVPEPRDLFGMMHLAREMMLKTVCRCPLAILRPTQIHGLVSSLHSYGRNLAYGPNLLRQLALRNGRITLSGNGQEKRDYMAIQDVAALTLQILRRRSDGTLNLATGTSVPLLDLAGKIAQRFTPPVPVETTPRPAPLGDRHFDTAAIGTAFPDFTLTALDDALDLAHRALVDGG